MSKFIEIGHAIFNISEVIALEQSVMTPHKAEITLVKEGGLPYKVNIHGTEAVETVKRHLQEKI